MKEVELERDYGGKWKIMDEICEICEKFEGLGKDLSG